MSLSVKAVERLFARFIATYGEEFMRKWGGAPMGDVKTAWSHELAGFAHERGLAQLAWALENLPEHPPNCIVFKNLARCAPKPAGTMALPAPADAQPADVARVAAEVAKLADARSRIVGTGNGREWALKLRDRMARGDKLTAAQRNMMAAALPALPALPAMAP